MTPMTRTTLSLMERTTNEFVSSRISCFSKITFLGANSLFGRVASALLSRTPAVRTLKLYDEVDILRLPPNGEPTCEVQWHRGKEELTIALEGSDIVVIGDDSKVILNNERDALISTASKVVDFVYAVAQTTPKAMVVVAASPLNLMVPLAGYVLKEVGCYDGRKLLGVTSVDTLRANAIYSEYIAQPNSILPVVGGASPQTRVPIFSHARPALDLPEEDLHRLIDKIKSFDLNMEGSALKASTLERAYATVRLVNSLLSGLQEEPSTKEMALAKTSLIPEVNYFSLPVDLGKFGIERTFGLPHLSQLETEMIDYAIINLNNDLIKAQDLYASFKPCFEMLQSIVGGPSRCNNETNENFSLLLDHKIDTRKKKEQKVKSNKRKRSEQVVRNRKRARTNKYPILHCPAPEVVTDMPIEEKFGKIERVHKKLQVNQIFQERIVDGLPRLRCNEVSDPGQPKSHSDIINSSSKMADRTNENNNSVSEILTCAAATNIQLAFLNSGTSKNIDFTDLQNNTKVVDKAAKQNLKCGNKLTNKDKTMGSKNVKVTIDLKCRIKKKNPYDHLQPHTQNQYARIEMMKSLMQQKQNPYQKPKALCRSNSSTSQNKIEYLKKKAKELKTSNVNQSLNNPISIKPQPTEKQKAVSESNNKAFLGKESSENSDAGKIPGSEKIEKLKMTSPENDSFDEQFSLLMDNIGEECRTRKSEGEIKLGIETNGDQEIDISKEEVHMPIANKEHNKNSLGNKVVDLDINSKMNEMYSEMEPHTGMESVSEYNKNSFENKVVDLNINGKINEINSEMKPKIVMEAVSEYNKNSIGNKVVDLNIDSKVNEINSEMEPNTGMESVTENISVKRHKITHESCTLNKETNGKALKEDKNDYPETFSCEEVQSTSLPDPGDNIPSELNEIKTIPEERAAAIEDKNETIDDKSGWIGSNASPEKGIDKEMYLENKNKAETTKEVEKHYIKASVYDVTKESLDGNISEKIIESTDHNKSANEIIGQKCSFIKGQTLDIGNPVIEIDAQEKLEELEYLSKRQKRDELKENNQKTTPKMSYDPSEQVNKIREITMRKIKEPLKYPNPPKLESIEKTEKDEETKTAMKMENIKDIKETKICLLEDEGPDSIEVFNYEPKNMHDTKNITNINEMIQSLVSPNEPKEKSEQPPVTQISNNITKGDGPKVDSKSTRVKVMNLKKDAGKIFMKNQQHSKDGKLKKNDQRAPSIIKSDLKKAPKEIPFPLLDNIKGTPKDETFDKNKWLKQKTQSYVKENSPAKFNLKTIDESNALTIHSRNINESFTKRIQKNKCSNKTTDGIKTVSYAINTKSKKDELSKRYTVLKKGQICNMVKDDINADEIKAKLYKKSFKGVKPGVERDDKKNNLIKDLSFTDLLNYPPKNKEISDSTPLPNVLETTQIISNDITNDVNNNIYKNSKKTNNNNVIALKNKSFLNFVVNRISKRSPTLNETREAIGVRGSHYGSGTFSKNPTTPDEQKIQLLTKKAKDQLNITRFKNNKRMSPGLNGGLPVVSHELNEKRQPVAAMEQEDSTKSNKGSATDNMARSKNKIQLMKDKYQRLKNANLSVRNAYAASPTSGANLTKSKESYNNIYGVKSSFGESLKKSSKSNPEPKFEKVLTKKNEVVSKSRDTYSTKMPVKEITPKVLEKTKSESQDQISAEMDNSLSDSNTNRKQDINCSEVYDKNRPPEMEVQVAELPQINQNPAPSDDKSMTTIAVNNKICPPENQQGSQDKNKSVEGNFDKEQEMLKSTEEEKYITATGNMKPTKDENTSNVEKLNKISNAKFNKSDPKKKVSNDRTKVICNLKQKENNKEINDVYRHKESTNTATREKCQQSKLNALTKIKLPTKKPKPDENAQNAALKAVFSSRPTAGDLIKMRQERKTPETDAAKSKSHKIPPLNFGVRAGVENNLIPRNSTASSLLLDPDIERRPSTTRKVIHPRLMHAVKPFSSQNTDLTKLKTNFYSRWTPHTLKMKSDKEDDDNKSKNERIQKNPFVSGKINLTSDVFKAYMKKNRNYEFTNSNGDVQFLHQSGQLVSIPQQGVSANTSRINDQRVAFSTLEANPERTGIPKKEATKTQIAVSTFRFNNNPKPLVREKPNIPSSSLFKKQMRIHKNYEEMVTKEPQTKGKNALISSYKSQSPIVPRDKPVLNRSKTTSHPFRCREKEVDLKKMHLLKAFQIPENNDQKFEELQRNYKQSKFPRTNSTNAFHNQQRKESKETPNRLNMLNRPSVESIKKVPTVEIRRNKKPFSAPANYHPSFPLSKPKKHEKIKKDESGNTLKKRWTQLLDIFQSVITTEKKHWEHESPDKNLLVAGSPHMSNNALIPKPKINLRETSHNSNSTARIVQSYYRRHSSGGSKLQGSYSISNITNKP